MPKLLITCPTKGAPVFTGMDLPRNMIMENIRNMTLVCPLCEKPHKWDGKDAWFEPAKPQDN